MSARDLPTPVSLGVRRSLLPVFKAAAVSRPETGRCGACRRLDCTGPHLRRAVRLSLRARDVRADVCSCDAMYVGEWDVFVHVESVRECVCARACV